MKIRCRYNKKKIFCCTGVLIVIVILLHPSRHTANYEFLAKEEILNNLYEEVAANFTSTAALDCDYRDIISDETSLSIGLVDNPGDLMEGHRIREGGEYAPQDCRPKYSTAIIVPYRDRPERLRSFLVYMHTFLRRQKIHYRIYVIEQVDSRLFNRGKLLNIGAVAAMKAGYPCLVLHDVDLLPLSPANLYSCTKQPRHMAANINKFRFVLTYLNYVGGALSIASKQYKAMNGMSNEYYGWGGEDDDFYYKLKEHKILVCRFEPAFNKYYAFSHLSPIKGEKRTQLANRAKSEILADGLSSMKYTEVATVLHPLFTHIMVDL